MSPVVSGNHVGYLGEEMMYLNNTATNNSDWMAGSVVGIAEPSVMLACRQADRKTGRQADQGWTREL